MGRFPTLNILTTHLVKTLSDLSSPQSQIQPGQQEAWSPAKSFTRVTQHCHLRNIPAIGHARDILCSATQQDTTTSLSKCKDCFPFLDFTRSSHFSFPCPCELTFVCDFITGGQNPFIQSVKQVTKTTKSALQKTSEMWPRICCKRILDRSQRRGQPVLLSPDYDQLYQESTYTVSLSTFSKSKNTWKNALHVSHQKLDHHRGKQEHQLIFLCG